MDTLVNMVIMFEMVIMVIMVIMANIVLIVIWLSLGAPYRRTINFLATK